MSTFWSLYRVELTAHHRQPDRTKHALVNSSGKHDFPPFKFLTICGQDDTTDQGYYLMYVPETGPGTDTWHQTLEDAMAQAEWEFGVTRDEWMKTDCPY
jgi:hypothetical protein